MSGAEPGDRRPHRDRSGMRGVSGDPDFERTLDTLKRSERRKLIALGTALASVALMLFGTWIWDWSWGGRAS